MITGIRYGNTNTFLIRGSKANMLVDTDYAGTLPAFYKAIKDLDIRISDIGYVIATHYHPDHMGIVSELTDKGVTLLIMESQLPYIHYSDNIFEKEPHLDFKPIDPDKARILRFDEARLFLAGIGIEGEIISTPSHSKDSISVVLDDGTCIVGDLEPYEYLEAYEDNKALKEDWDRIMSYKPMRICYAHANEKRIY